MATRQYTLTFTIFFQEYFYLEQIIEFLREHFRWHSFHKLWIFKENVFILTKNDEFWKNIFAKFSWTKIDDFKDNLVKDVLTYIFKGPLTSSHQFLRTKFEGLPGLLIDVFQEYVYKNLKKFLSIHVLIFFRKLLYGLTGQKSWGL